MRIPKYWAHGKYLLRDKYSFFAWRWSDTSLAEAQQLANDKAREIALKFQNGQRLDRYTYDRNPIREEIIRAIKNDSGKELGILTRNTYGALVLNAASAMFIDIDFPEKNSLANGIGKLFGNKAPSPEQVHLQHVEQWSQKNPAWGLRVYRTFGGLRCLVTNEIFDPTQESSLAVLRELKSDPLYITLCKQQESFRARLTPKPWRCGIHNPPSRYPWDDLRQEQVYRQWENKYNQTSARFATCRLVKQIGRDETHPDVEPILRLHDDMSCAVDNRNLA
ncbi:MAG: hypothetical protein HZB51_28150 [Chloroflexi bacterium]|nr:hypothetical protein [Chloroflexota bacterium]